MAPKNEAASKQDTAAKTSKTAPLNATVIRYGGREDDDLAGVILTWFVQVTGLAAAVTFGIFSVLSWTTAREAKTQANTAIQQANTANQQATAANLLALAALCGNTADQNTTYNKEVRKFCNQLFPYAWTPLASAASSMFPGIGTVTPPTASSGTPSSIPSSEPPSGTEAGESVGLNTGAQVGLGVGLTVGFVVVFITILTIVRRRRKRQYERSE